MAPGTERDIKDDVFDEDPGLKACIEHGDLVVVGGNKRRPSKSKSTSSATKKESAEKDSLKDGVVKKDDSAKPKESNPEVKKG